MFKVRSVFCLLALTLHREHFLVLNDFLKSIGYILFQGCVGWLCCNSNGFCSGEMFAMTDWVAVPVLELHLWEPGEHSLNKCIFWPRLWPLSHKAPAVSFLILRGITSPLEQTRLWSSG